MHSAFRRAFKKAAHLSQPAESHAAKPNVPAVVRSSPEDFELQKTLGRGAFGRVFFAKKKSDPSKPLAVKRLRKDAIMTNHQVHHTKNEKNILARMHHPFIVELDSAFQDRQYLYLAMDFIVGGEFFTHLRKCRRFDDVSARFYLAQVVMAIEFCHSLNIVYRDLKPENILMDADGYLKLTDFGLAKEIEFRTYTLCGTPDYFAPEILLCRGYGKPVDWWAVGVVLYEMVVGYPPFIGEDAMDTYRKIIDCKVLLPEYLSTNARVLIRHLVTKDLTKRYGNLKNGVNDIKASAWFKSVPFEDIYKRRIVAPYKPKVKGVDDVSNFKDYPDSYDAPPAILVADDPFKDW